MRTKTIKIINCRNELFNGKVGIVSENEIQIGRTTYKNLLWERHQPGRPDGDFTMKTSTVDDMVGFGFTRSRNGKNATRVFEYEIIE